MMKLILTTFLLLLVNVARVAAADTDEMEVTKFRLTSANLEQYSKASSALMTMMQGDASLKKRFNDEQKNKTIAQTTETIEKNYPNVAGAIRGAGMTTHDYVVMTATIISSAMAVGMKKQGMLKELPPTIAPENAAFVEQNYERVGALMQKLQAASN
jgi:hypothetical protein